MGVGETFYQAVFVNKVTFLSTNFNTGGKDYVRSRNKSAGF